MKGTRNLECFETDVRSLRFAMNGIGRPGTFAFGCANSLGESRIHAANSILQKLTDKGYLDAWCISLGSIGKLYGTNNAEQL